MFTAVIIVVLSFSVFSQEPIDARLGQYIKDFKLVPLSQPSAVNTKLFELGHRLFRERKISGNNNIACMDCHHPRVMTHDGIPLSLGEGAKGIQDGDKLRLQGSGKILARNTPALFNLHNIQVMFWDGRVEFTPETHQFMTPVKLKSEVQKTLKSALAAQAIFPMVDHAEMRGQKGTNPIADAKSEYEAWDMIVTKILQDPDYKKLFDEVFPGETINIGHFGEALAEFQGKNFFFADTPYDRYIQGNLTALTTKQKLGMEIFFNKGKCGDCHQGEHLSALDFDNVASPQIGPGRQNGDDLGRFEWDGDESSRYAFRVPPLRNVGLTAPYFHNGSMRTLEDVVEHYDDIRRSLESFKILEQLKNYTSPLKDHDHATNETRLSLLPEDLPLILRLTEEEEEALVEFMRFGLTDLRLHRFLPKP